MVMTVLLAAMAMLIVLLVGAVYSALVIAHKTDEMVQAANEESGRMSVRPEHVIRRKNALGNV